MKYLLAERGRSGIVISSMQIFDSIAQMQHYVQEKDLGPKGWYWHLAWEIPNPLQDDGSRGGKKLSMDVMREIGIRPPKN